MLVTVYQRRRTGWRQVKQYYEFHVPDAERIPGTLEVPKQPCPGCGKRMSANAQNQHTCFGGTDRYPKINNDRFRVSAERANAQAVEDYIKSVKHKVVISDDK